MRFADKVAFITGGGGGVGSQLARSFSTEGARLFVTDNRFELAQKVAQEICAAGGKAVANRLDVASPREIKASVEAAMKEFGRIDILVNCAGITYVHSFEEITEEAWDKIMNVNAKGTFFCCQAVAQKMIETGVHGKIVNIASSAAKLGFSLYLDYCASKFAVLGITRTLAQEVAKYHINVNAVCPTEIDTEMLWGEMKIHAKNRHIPESKVKEEWIARYPLGRICTPLDVTKSILFLASDDADHITGEEIDINGGMQM